MKRRKLYMLNHDYCTNGLTSDTKFTRENGDVVRVEVGMDCKKQESGEGVLVTSRKETRRPS